VAIGSCVGGFALALVALVTQTRTAGAAVYMTQSEALAQAFPEARLERRPFFLSSQQARDVERLARVKAPSKLITTYLAWRGDTLQGTAFFETRVVRTMPAVLMVVIGPDTTVARVDVLAFHEPMDYLPGSRWLGLFPKRKLDDRLWPGRSIRNLSGATLTTRAITESVRLSLALFEKVVAPALGVR